MKWIEMILSLILLIYLFLGWAHGKALIINTAIRLSVKRKLNISIKAIH